MQLCYLNMSVSNAVCAPKLKIQNRIITLSIVYVVNQFGHLVVRFQYSIHIYMYGSYLEQSKRISLCVTR